MTVEELIERLLRFRPDAPVFVKVDVLDPTKTKSPKFRTLRVAPVTVDHGPGEVIIEAESAL